MTQAAPVIQHSSTAPRNTAWLYGPVIDLTLGAGGLYLLSLVPLFFFARSYGIESWSLVLVAFFTLAINTPHYGATLLRVYDRAQDRHRYAIFGTFITLGIAAAFVVSLRWFWLGSFLITLYATWTPWHFAGQNYGVSMTLLRRGGCPISETTRRLFHASFVLSALLAMLTVHVADANAVYSAGITRVGVSYDILRLGIPESIARLLFPVLASLYAIVTLASLTSFARAGGLRDMLPASMLVATQALWFSVPAGLRILDPTSNLNLIFAVIWVSTCHSLQYLWITSYYARQTEPPARPATFLWKSLAAGSLINVLPGLLFAPALLGTVSWEAGLAVLVFSVVNIHHFMLDGAVWKLRDGAVARALLRRNDAPPPEPGSRISPLRRFVYAAGLASCAIPLVMAWELIVAYPAASGDLLKLRRSADHLAWIGRDNPTVLQALASRQLHDGAIDEALENYRRSNEVLPDYRQLNNLAWVLATQKPDDPRSVSEAYALVQLAASGDGARDPNILDTVAVVYAAQGRFDDARRTANQALRLARQSGQEALASQIQARLQLYRANRSYRP